MTGSDDSIKADAPVVVFSSIRRKLTAIILGVSLVAMVLSVGLIVLNQVVTFRKSMARAHVLRTRMIANNCPGAVSFDDPEDALLVLQTLSVWPSMAYAGVIRADGEILADYRRDGFRDDPQPYLTSGQHLFKGPWLLAQEPIVLDGRVIGSVFLQSDLTEFATYRRQIVSVVIVNLLIVFFVAWCVSFLSQKLISGPVERLTAMMLAVSHHRDYSIRAPDARDDEIGILARAFNQMLGEVELRDEQLKVREQRTKEYLDVAGVMIVALSPEGIVTLMNPKGCEILGMAETDILGKDWFEHFIPERLREDTRTVFHKVVTGQIEAVHYHENAILTADGEERLISWNNSAIRDEDGHIASVLSSGEDITDRRQAEEREAALQKQLVRAERMESIGVLAGGVAHDLNNVLGPMVVLPDFIEEGLDSVVKGDAAAEQEVRESLDIVKTAAKRAASVVRDLVALSRRGHYERIPTDLTKMPCFFSDAASRVTIGSRFPDVEISEHVCQGPLVVLASEHHLCRVIDNLVRNAAEAIIGKGTVTVTVSEKVFQDTYDGFMTVPPGRYAVIQVSDTGEGIEKEQLGRIFEPFYTKKAKTERSGSGLGLSIVHSIVDDHEGYVDVKSEVGRGTTFALYFPLTDVRGRVAASNDQLVIQGKGRILVVDDEPGQRHLALRCLKRMGYEAEAVEDGHTAVQRFAGAKEHEYTSPYDLVVLDMVMEADFDGLATLKEVRALYPDQKVLIVSGHAEDDRTRDALACGADWLAKPYSISGLGRAVAQTLSPENS